MKISVVAKPKSKKEFVEKISGFTYRVAVKEEAREGKANKAVVDLLAKYFNIPKSEVRIVSGENIKQKIIEIPLGEEQLEEIEESKELQTKLF